MIQVLQRLPSLIDGERLFSVERRRTWLIGNGGSAAVASHIANDLVATGRSAVALTESAILSASANDHGWPEGFARQIIAQFDIGDLLVAISSSGRSENILRAVRCAKNCGGIVLTLSAFDADNPLRSEGDVNLWVDTHNYGVAEAAHLCMLHEIVNP